MAVYNLHSHKYMWLLVLECSDGDVRLVDGDNYNATSGRVELCIGERWGTVCRQRRDRNDADIVCRQLGLSTFCKAT